MREVVFIINACYVMKIVEKALTRVQGEKVVISNEGHVKNI